MSVSLPRFPCSCRDRGLRLRLTLIYTSLLAAAFLIFAALLHTLFARSLRAALDAEIFSDTQYAASLLRRAAADAARKGERDILRGSDEFKSMPPDTYLQVLDPQGHSLLSSQRLGASRLWRETSSVPHAPTRETLDHPILGRLRCLALPVTTSRGTYTVIGAESLTRVERAIRTLHHLFLYTLPALLLVVGLLGYALAGRALRPVAEITATAQAIRSGDLSRRIALRGPNDELKQLADTFDDMIASLEQLLTSQQRFFADASHELRTPLTVILSALSVNLRSREANADSLREAMQVAQDEAQRMKRLVEDLMVLARADVGEQPLRCESIQLDDLLKGVCESAQWMMGNQRLSLDLDEEVTLMVDADRVKQLVLNLLDNAVKHTSPEGEVRVALHAHDGRAHLTVSDNGEGIPPEHLPHVFDRFYRVDKARSREPRSLQENGNRGEHGGAGLGLAICRWIAEAHGGTLTVQSEVGRGTTFTLSLPLSSPSDIAD